MMKLMLHVEANYANRKRGKYICQFARHFFRIHMFVVDTTSTYK